MYQIIKVENAISQPKSGNYRLFHLPGLSPANTVDDLHDQLD